MLSAAGHTVTIQIGQPVDFSDIVSRCQKAASIREQQQVCEFKSATGSAASLPPDHMIAAGVAGHYAEDTPEYAVFGEAELAEHITDPCSCHCASDLIAHVTCPWFGSQGSYLPRSLLAKCINACNPSKIIAYAPPHSVRLHALA